MKPDMKALSARGHAAKAAKKAALLEQREWPLVDAHDKPRPIASPADCETLTSWAAQMLAKGQITWHDAHELTVASNAWIKAYESGVAAQERAELKALIEEIQAHTAAAAGKRAAPGVIAMKRKGQEALQKKQARNQDDEVPPELVQRVNAVVERILKGVGE